MNISIPLELEYNNKLIKLERPEHQITIVLENGTHKISSRPIECGIAKHIEGETKVLYATISFKYDFDEKESQMTIISNEIESPDSVHFRIGHPGYSQITSFKKEESVSSLEGIKDITHQSQLFPNLKSIINEQRMKIKNAIIDESNKKGVTVFVKSPFPKMDYEDYTNLSLVYNVNEKTIETFQIDKTYGTAERIFHGRESLYEQQYDICFKKTCKGFLERI